MLSKAISFYKGKFNLGLYEWRKQHVIHLPELVFGHNQSSHGCKLHVMDELPSMWIETQERCGKYPPLG